MVLTKRIPEQYDYNFQEVEQAINNIIPGKTWGTKGRIFWFSDKVTATEKKQIKAAVIPLLTEIKDITI